MKREPLVFVGTCDLAGLVRGKGFPAEELPMRLRRGIGFTHSNIMMSPFGPIYDTPFGTAGDLMLVPDASTRVEVEFDEYSAAERFYLGDLLTTDELFPAQMKPFDPDAPDAESFLFSFETLKQLRWKDLVDEGYIIAGSPATVRERLRDVVKQLNVGHVMCLLHFGNLSKEQTLRNTELYAREVMPQLKGLWSGWTDHWYPQPLREEERVTQTNSFAANAHA